MSEEATVRLMCPNLSCQRILSVPEEARGKLVKCRSCGTTLRVPNSRAKQSASPAQTETDEAA